MSTKKFKAHLRAKVRENKKDKKNKENSEQPLILSHHRNLQHATLNKNILESMLLKWSELSPLEQVIYGIIILTSFGITGVALSYYLPIFIQQLNLTFSQLPKTKISTPPSSSLISPNFHPSTPTPEKTVLEPSRTKINTPSSSPLISPNFHPSTPTPKKTVKPFNSPIGTSSSFYKHDRLRKLILNFNCVYDLNFIKKYIKPENLTSFLKLLNKINVAVKKNLPFVLNRTILEKILSAPDFRIFIAPQEYMVDLDGSMRDGGILKDNIIVLACDMRFLVDEGLLREVLRNEFHHIAQLNSNRKKMVFEESFPFYSHNGVYDRSLKERISKVINSSIDLVKYYTYLFNDHLTYEDLRQKDAIKKRLKQDKNIDSIILNNENIAKQQLLEAIQDYEPRSYTFKLNKVEYKAFIQQGIISKDKHNHDILLNVPNEIRYIRAKWEEGNIVHFRITFATNDDNEYSKVKAFFKDFNQVIERSKTLPTYLKSDDKYLNELCSDIEELPTDLKKLLFPGWCAYFNEYHQIEDYCSREELEVTSPTLKP